MGLPGTTPPQTTIDRLPDHMVVKEQEAQAAPHNPSTTALVAIEAIEEVGTIIAVEA